MKRWFFIVGATVIAAAYYISAKLFIRDIEAFNDGIQKSIKALTEAYNAVDSTIEEVEESPYYWPALPKPTEKEWMEQE
jgi:hypothetical protein